MVVKSQNTGLCCADELRVSPRPARLNRAGIRSAALLIVLLGTVLTQGHSAGAAERPQAILGRATIIDGVMADYPRLPLSLQDLRAACEVAG